MAWANAQAISYFKNMARKSTAHTHVECPRLILARRGIFIQDMPDKLYVLNEYTYEPQNQHMCYWCFIEVETDKKFWFTTYGFTPRGYIEGLSTPL